MNVDLRELVVHSFQAAQHAAAQAATVVPATNGDALQSDEALLAQRVHHFRKAVRRARAILELVWDALPRDQRRDTRDSLRASRRALGDARDHSVVPHALMELELSDVMRASAHQIVAGAKPPMASDVQTRLEEGAALVRLELDRVIGALPEAITWSVVRHGIERVYRRARRARKRSRSDVHQFHVWRRRSKELAYQLDALADAFGERMAAIAHDLDPILDAQSIGVDVIMVCQFLRVHAVDVPGIVADPLIDELDRRIDDHIRLAKHESRAMFSTKPSDFARAVRHAGRIEPARDTIASDA